jgi:predicted Rossmann-fold nucleotide-binding protein
MTNRRVSRAAGDVAELTEGTGAARAQRRSRNGRRTSVSGGGLPGCMRRAREGARELGCGRK